MPVTGKLGRKPLDRERPRLILEKYLDPRVKLSTAGLPPVSFSQDVDRSSQVSQIPMYCNDTLGCCTIAGLGHLFGAVSVYGGRPEVLFSDSEIIKTYSRVGGYDPNQVQPDGTNPTDQGCECIDVLNDAVTNGMTGTDGAAHKIEAHAMLGNPADEELLAQCLDVFGSVYLGFNVQQHMMTQTQDGQVWTWQPGDTEIGGHCVVQQRRYPAGSMHGILEEWTWGERQRADFGWQASAVEEAHIAITPEWIQANGTSVAGLDVQQMLADMQYVTQD
jgi:hypothetical protein